MVEQATSERSIFLAAIEQRSPEERAAFVDRACGDDARLRKGVIREEDPPKPSTRLSELSSPLDGSGPPSNPPTSSLASVAAQRHTEPAKLTKLVRGELDWIVMKALEKDRNRCYETANGFAMDVLLDALSKAGQLDAALAEYEAQVRREPEDALSHYLLAQALSRQRRWQDAADHFTRVLALNASYPEVHAERAAAYQALGRWEKAIADFSKDIELRPNLPAAHHALAWRLATCPDPQYRDPPRAVTAAKRAIELAPTQGTLWRTLGAAQYRAGDWSAAVGALEKSMELRKGGNSFDWFFLAMAHWQLGNKDEARKWYDKAVQWTDKNQPNNEELRRFRAEAAELMGVEKKKD